MVRLYQPTHRRYSDQGLIIPNVEFSEGVRPWIGTEVAPYLPLRQFEEYHNDYYVILTGKAVSMDSLGFVTLSGLRAQQHAIQDFATYNAGNDLVDIGSGDGDGIGPFTRYDAVDVAQGVLDSEGRAVVALQPVIWSFMKNNANQTEQTQAAAAYAEVATVHDIDTEAGQVDGFTFENAGAITVSAPVGVSPYSYYRTSRASGQAAPYELRPYGHSITATDYAVWDPTQLRFHNHNKQGRVAILCDYACEYPVVSAFDSAAVGLEDVGLMEGASAFVAALANIRPGKFVTYDVHSNLTLQAEGGGGSTVGLVDAFEGPNLDQLDFDAEAGALAEQQTSTLVGRYINERLGQIIRYIPRHVNTAHLDRVRSRFEAGAGADFTDIDRLPGTANAGLPWSNWVTGRTDNNEDGTIVINLTTR